MYQLLIENGPWRGRRVTVRAGDLTVGGGPDSDLRIMLNGLAGRHARLRPDGEGEVRLDAISGAPLSVNGIPKESVRLVDGDRIALGPLLLVYRGGKSAPGRSGRKRLSGMQVLGAVAVALALCFQGGLMTVLWKLSHEQTLAGSVSTPIQNAPAAESVKQVPKEDEPLWPQSDATRKILF